MPRYNEAAAPPLPPVLLTVPQAAALLAISRAACYRLLATGRLGSVTIGRARRVPLAALDEFVAALRDDEVSVAPDRIGWRPSEGGNRKPKGLS